LDLEDSTWSDWTTGIPKETRDLIRTMSQMNVFLGAPRIHSELLKLGIKISRATVAKYMARRPKPPSQTWRTFLHNHVSQLASTDFFTVSTLWFEILFVFIVLRHDGRRVAHFNVTAHPTAEWTAQQMLEAFPSDSAPKYLTVAVIACWLSVEIAVAPAWRHQRR
jgi:putative transposase